MFHFSQTKSGQKSPLCAGHLGTAQIPKVYPNTTAAYLIQMTDKFKALDGTPRCAAIALRTGKPIAKSDLNSGTSDSPCPDSCLARYDVGTIPCGRPPAFSMIFRAGETTIPSRSSVNSNGVAHYSPGLFQPWVFARQHIHRLRKTPFRRIVR